MPELPEVESQRRDLEASCVGMQLQGINPLEQGGGGREGLFDDKVIGEEMTAAGIEASLQGKWVIAARRRGKQMWLEFGVTRDAATPSLCLLMHLGMTGGINVRGGEGPKYKTAKPRTNDTEVWPPRFTKLELTFAGDEGSGCTIAFCDSRRFGRIYLREGDAASAPPISKLAADPIIDPPSVATFASMLAASSMPVKAALLDQNRIVCGVGNWVADEVLYQAEILPAAPCNSLSLEQASALHTQILSVCQLACAANGAREEFPENWLFHHRWANQTKGSISSPLGTIHFDTVGGRTTAFLPHR
ncbi:Formamidopyrimidine-DNA glycosylase N-terminal domain-containing protein [Pavlovales sp. CCMP2436]|nr:Formamidopyrimidine-DNA glycosylase N-terminal domain-containing protein [Pavlovales sp. CCMP2436]